MYLYQINLTLFIIKNCVLIYLQAFIRNYYKKKYCNFAQHLLWILRRNTDYPLHGSVSLVSNALHKTSVLYTGSHLFSPKELACFSLVIQSCETPSVSLFAFAPGTLASSFKISHKKWANFLVGMLDLSRPCFCITILLILLYLPLFKSNVTNSFGKPMNTWMNELWRSAGRWVTVTGHVS